MREIMIWDKKNKMEHMRERKRDREEREIDVLGWLPLLAANHLKLLLHVVQRVAAIPQQQFQAVLLLLYFFLPVNGWKQQHNRHQIFENLLQTCSCFEHICFTVWPFRGRSNPTHSHSRCEFPQLNRASWFIMLKVTHLVYIIIFRCQHHSTISINYRMLRTIENF